MLFSFSPDSSTSAAIEAKVRQRLAEPQIVDVRVLQTNQLPDRKEFQTSDGRVLLFEDSLSTPDAPVQRQELVQLKDEFNTRMGKRALSVETPYQAWVNDDAKRQLSCSALFDSSSQFFVYVDRNPNVQKAAVLFYDAGSDSIHALGWVAVSTGNPKRRGYYETPTGVFKHLIELGYRALGTRNENGLRGLGQKGMRVWDFGWQEAAGVSGPMTIRLLMHATDPDYKNSLLGKRDSKGCVRIPAEFNRFVDHFSLLDRESDKAQSWLLKKDREAVRAPGSLLVVGDSRD
jgi:hypothetical protein